VRSLIIFNIYGGKRLQGLEDEEKGYYFPLGVLTFGAVCGGRSFN